MEDIFTVFIESLTDHELAIYIGYQYPSFLGYSKEKVKREIGKRKLSKEQLRNYFNTKLSYNEKGIFCERCGSNKFFSDIDIEHHSRKYSSYDLEVNTKRCRLCNYNPSKAPARRSL